MKEPVLTTHHLQVGYREGHITRVLLDDLSLNAREGEIICLVGANGMGKSTLLRTLAGMHPPLAGRVCLGTANVHTMPAEERARHIAAVLPGRQDVGMLTAREVVALGRYPFTGMWGHLRARDWAVVDAALDAVGASHLRTRMASTLSDGEWQKVMIARALAQEPRVMILDEPTAFLDVHHRAEVMALLRSLAHDHGRTVLLSTHDLDMALHTADRMWIITPQREIRTGAPEDLVLDGTLERAFPSQQVTFDLSTGMFRVPMRVRGEVRLVGQGVRAYWTRRALERAGWRVVEDSTRAAVTVSIIVQGKRTAWLITQGTHRRLCHTLYDVVTHLSSREGEVNASPRGISPLPRHSQTHG